MINPHDFRVEIELFKDRLAPHLEQKTQLELAKFDMQKKIELEAIKTKHPIERVLLTAICGELKTTQQKAEFVSRLLLLDLLTEYGT